MLKLYGFPQTRATRAVWALEETGADYEYVKIDLMKGEGFKPPYIKLNPGGKVPALVDGDFVLTESAAICTYIGDKFPDAGLVPKPGTLERALYDKWCFFVIGELEQPLWTMTKHQFALPESLRVPAIMNTAAWEFSKAAGVLAQGLDEREFVVGEGFTAADILVAHTLNWARNYQLSLENERLEAYADRMLARSALTRARQREETGKIR